MLMMSTLLDFNSTSSLEQQSAGRHVAPFEILSRFRDSQSLLLLLIVVDFAKKQRMPILLSLVLPEWSSNTRSTTLEKSTLYPLS